MGAIREAEFHGDLRPENVVVTPKGSVKILNFGLARWTVGGRARVAAQAGGLNEDPHGVAGYLSPEQAVGTALDERSDLFSFGVVFYEMLAGRNPFIAATPAATVVNVVSMQVPPLTALPAELTALVARTLSKSVDGRPRSASVVSSELRRIGAALDAKEGNPPPTELIPAAPNRSNVWLLAVLAIVVIVAAWFVFNP